MTAGAVQVTAKDGGGTARNVNQWSSDSTLGGNLTPMIHAVDGEIETIGAKADAAYASGAGSVISILKGLFGARVDAAVVAQALTGSTTVVYAAGNVMGAVMTFAGMGRAAGGSGTLVDAAVIFADSQTQPLDLLIFSSAPSAVTDHAPLALSAGDAAKLIRVIHLADYTSLGTPSIVEQHGLATKYVSDGTGNLYGILVSRGTPTLASTTDVTVQLGVERNG